MRAFISGPLNLTQAQFDEMYRPEIIAAVMRGDTFIVGDAPGTDTMAQKLLHLGGVTGVTVVWCGAFPEPRNFLDERWNKIGVGKNQTQKDTYMTKNSDYDIAFPLRKESGVQRNIDRRDK